MQYRLDFSEEKVAKIREWRNILEVTGTTRTSQKIKELEEQLEDKKSVLIALENNFNGLNSHMILAVQQVKIKEEEKLNIQASVQVLNEELGNLKAEMTQQAIKDVEKDAKIKELNSIEKKLSETNQKLDDEIKTKNQEKLLANDTIKSLTEELSNVKTKAKQQEKDKEAVFAEEKKKLQQEAKNQQEELDNLQKLINESAEAQKKYEQANNEKKDTHFARMERMAPIFLRVQELEKKAENLGKRKEITAQEAVIFLTKNIRDEVAKYASSSEPNEDTALASFQEKVQQHVSNSEAILGKHRKEWKYILGNISLAIALVGVGYVAAGLINKKRTGCFTFFNKTETKKQAEELVQVAAKISF